MRNRTYRQACAVSVGTSLTVLTSTAGSPHPDAKTLAKLGPGVVDPTPPPRAAVSR